MDLLTKLEIAHAYSHLEVENMDLSQLKELARRCVVSEMCDESSCVDEEVLLESLINHSEFEGDTDRVREFMVANGANDADAEKAIAAFMA